MVVYDTEITRGMGMGWKGVVPWDEGWGQQKWKLSGKWWWQSITNKMQRWKWRTGQKRGNHGACQGWKAGCIEVARHWATYQPQENLDNPNPSRMEISQIKRNLQVFEIRENTASKLMQKNFQTCLWALSKHMLLSFKVHLASLLCTFNRT